MRSIEPGISRFRAWSFGPSRNDENKLLRQIPFQFRPARVGFPQNPLGLGGEGIAVFLAAEQIEPLPRYQPEPRVAGHRDAPRQVDRVVAAEPGAVNLGMGGKGGAVALIAETPDRPGLGGLEIRQTQQG